MKHGFGLLLESAKNYVETYPERWKAKSTWGKITTVALGSAVAACCAASFIFPPAGAGVAGLALVGTNIIGLGAYGMMLSAQSINKNADVLKVMPFATGALAVQKFLLNGLGYATVAAIACVRTGILGRMPQEWTLARRAVAATTWAAGTTALLFLPPNPLNILPFASMTMASIGDSLPDKWSQYSRLGRGIAFLSNALYSGLATGSALNVAMDLTVGQTAANAIKKFDIPKNAEGQKVPFMDRLALYAEKVLTFQPMPKVYPELADTIKRVEPKTTAGAREDNVLYWTRTADPFSHGTKPSTSPTQTPAPPIHANFDRGTNPFAAGSTQQANTDTGARLRRVAVYPDLAA